MEALRAFAESVGYNGDNDSNDDDDGDFDIMDGVVTQCAGGAIEEIHWTKKDLDGTLPVGDLNMPKLRVLDLSDNSYLSGCLSSHYCRVEPKASDRMPGMKYDTLMPEDIEPYLNGRSWKDLKVGDEIAFPEQDDSLTPESLVGRGITVNEEHQGNIDSFDPSTGKHEVVFDDGDKESYDFKDEENAGAFEIEEAEAYFDVRGVCIFRGLAQLHLPVGLQDLNLRKTKVTGKHRLEEGRFPDFKI
jgi:hypothetical protein